jgi:magnesium-transporting ATPase (P-type)
MMIPISLKVSMDIIKSWYASLISQDTAMRGFNGNSHNNSSSATNSALCEDLGMVTHVLTDKTGTLTENVMVLRAISVPGCGNFGGVEEERAVATFSSRSFHRGVGVRGAGALDSADASLAPPIHRRGRVSTGNSLLSEGMGKDDWKEDLTGDTGVNSSPPSGGWGRQFFTPSDTSNNRWVDDDEEEVEYSEVVRGYFL